MKLGKHEKQNRKTGGVRERSLTHDKFKRIFGEGADQASIEFAILLNLNLARLHSAGKTSNTVNEMSRSYLALARYYWELACTFGCRLRDLSVYEALIMEDKAG